MSTWRTNAHLAAGVRAAADPPHALITLAHSYVIPHLSKKGYKYNVVLTGSGTFFNSRWLHIYSEVMPRQVRDYVNDHFNCEDIAFNMMMSNATGLPPVLVVGSTHTTHSVQENSKAHKGLRTRHGHVSGRSDCIKHLVKMCVRLFAARVEHAQLVVAAL